MTGRADTTGAATPVLVAATGEVLDLDVARWHAEVDDVEAGLLGGLPDPVLDVGCGPGRIVAALAGAGRLARGVDPNPAAVALAARRRAPVLRRSVFAPLPGERRWGTVLLLDGNVGIGGDPAALLARARQLLRPGGQVLAELTPPGSPTGALTVRVESPAGVGPWFRWARVGAGAFAAVAARAGLAAPAVEEVGGRWFGRAVRP
ncbi:MAG TPA: methyltransferase domain-containing protein [Acidimicrobiales bacterium]